MLNNKIHTIILVYKLQNYWSSLFNSIEDLEILFIIFSLFIFSAISFSIDISTYGVRIFWESVDLSLFLIIFNLKKLFHMLLVISKHIYLFYLSFIFIYFFFCYWMKKKQSI